VLFDVYVFNGDAVDSVAAGAVPGELVMKGANGPGGSQQDKGDDLLVNAFIDTVIEQQASAANAISMRVMQGKLLSK
jgi:hypothetical protein